jgi:hypothetical protein
MLINLVGVFSWEMATWITEKWDGNIQVHVGETNCDLL